MKTLILTSALLATALPAAADTLSLNLNGLKPQGQVMIALFDSETGYKADRATRSVAVPVSGPKARTTFDVPAGTYAIKAFHDLNGNGKLDTNPFGMPVEPFAFSNKAVGMMGPASWSAAAFKVSGDTVHALEF